MMLSSWWFPFFVFFYFKLGVDEEILSFCALAGSIK